MCTPLNFQRGKLTFEKLKKNGGGKAGETKEGGYFLENSTETQ